jgi:hypothetical protein
VQFKIVSRSSGIVGDYESGWKDVVYLPKGESVSFVAKFDDYSDAIHPFMYHCHFSNHEDGGMMGQFIVTGSATGMDETTHVKVPFTLAPNPASDRLFILPGDPKLVVYYVTVIDELGKAVLMLPQPEIGKGMDISSLKPGIYFVQLMDDKTKSITTQKFVRN